MSPQNHLRAKLRGRKIVASMLMPVAISVLNVYFSMPLHFHLESWRVDNSVVDHSAENNRYIRLSPTEYNGTRICQSPEQNVPWIYDGCSVINYHQNRSSQNSMFVSKPLALVGTSRTSGLTCGICKQNNFTRFLSRVSTVTRKLQRECRIIIFSVIFGKQTQKRLFNLALARSSEINKCMFIFVLESDARKSIENGDLYPASSKKEQLLWRSNLDTTAFRIPVPDEILPYKNLRRNVKLFKLHGHHFFVNARGLIWLDAKFGRDIPFHAFHRYFRNVVQARHSCLAVVRMPSARSSVGQDFNTSVPTLAGHCNHLLHARANATDSSDAIRYQCDMYHYQPNERSYQNAVLIDSALMVWDQSSSRCRQFNADLSCTWADEIVCNSDRDQISFPVTLLRMDVKQPAQDGGFAAGSVLTHDYYGRVAQMIPSFCHWYKRPSFVCAGRVFGENGYSSAIQM